MAVPQQPGGFGQFRPLLSGPSPADRSNVTVRVWQLCAGVLGLLLSAMLLAGGGYAIGLFFLAVTTVWLVFRLRVAEPGHVAGAFAVRRGRLKLAQTAVLLAIYVCVCATLFVAQHDNWSRHTEGQVATYALAGFAFLLLREMNRLGDSALNWLSGGWAEQAVGTSLAELREDGWTVIDNWLRDDGWGNIDHVVWGPNGAYAIETKSGSFRRSHLSQALGNAAWTKRKLGVRWVTAVVCVPGRAEPREDGYAWVVGRECLVEWLRKRPLSRDVPAGPSARQAASTVAV